MQTIRLRVNEKVYKNLIRLLSKFSKEEIQVIEENENSQDVMSQLRSVRYFRRQSDLANEKAKLTPILKLSNEEQLGWAVNKMDQKLLQEVNGFLMEIDGNQTRQNTIKRWIPYINL